MAESLTADRFHCSSFRNQAAHRSQDQLTRSERLERQCVQRVTTLEILGESVRSHS